MDLGERKEMFYLTTHSTCFIYGYMVFSSTNFCSNEPLSALLMKHVTRDFYHLILKCHHHLVSWWSAADHLEHTKNWELSVLVLFYDIII